MGDDLAKFEVQRMQLAASLTTVAESMRSCAALAESFATIVQNTKFGTGSSNSIHEDGTVPKGRKRKVMGGDDEKPTKRTRTPKDPNAPKRPASSYILFQNEVRKGLKEEHPNITNSELLAMIAKMWSDMSDADKAVYNSQVASAKEQYSQEKKAYDSRSPEEVAAANAATAAALAAKKAAPRTRAPKAAAVAPVLAPPVATTSPSSNSSEASETDSEEEEELEKGKAHHEVSEHDSDESEEDEEEEAPPPAKRTKGKVVTPAPKEKEKKKRGGK
ncbi:Non-histone chromosomal protein 6 [Hypsizygus marmoreus]|uniref:Non-histone chromosomal protein 6 n=1 Tax=Hypsizygus marmoreus TaxID=39966 RepID=A0A369J2A5_HYPMA|nr:Non-histone chromosomal protein 6 [Hypsizygus marmoreus]